MPKFLISLLLTAALASQAQPAKTNDVPKPKLPPATFHNVKYGPHERNVLDFWQAKSDKPTPLLFYVHGGGWRAGGKEAVPLKVLTNLLAHQISVVSINYRYIQQAILPAPVHDAARALQFVRSKAADWNLDKTRIAAMGVSAGACTSMWLAYHDDLADPKSDDPIARESTRVCAAVSISGQTSIDPKVAGPWVGDEILKHGMLWASVGAASPAEAAAKYDQYQPLFHEFSPINHISKGAPPVFLYYRTPTPLPAPTAGIAIHHAMLGKKLKEKADSVGVPCELQFDEKAMEHGAPVQAFLLEHLKP